MRAERSDLRGERSDLRAERSDLRGLKAEMLTKQACNKSGIRCIHARWRETDISRFLDLEPQNRTDCGDWVSSRRQKTTSFPDLGEIGAIGIPIAVWAWCIIELSRLSVLSHGGKHESKEASQALRCASGDSSASRLDTVVPGGAARSRYGRERAASHRTLGSKIRQSVRWTARGRGMEG